MFIRSTWISYCVGILLYLMPPAVLAVTPTTVISSPLPGFRTVETAIPAATQPTSRPARPIGYLGIAVARDTAGRIIVQHVDPASPAGGSGIHEGDIVQRFGNEDLTRAESLQENLLGLSAGDTVKLKLLRDGKNIELSAVLAPLSRPMKLPGQRALMGLQLRDGPLGTGVMIQSVQPDMPAEKAGVKAGDVVVEFDGVAVPARQSLTDALATRSPDEEVKLTLKRDGKLEEIRLKLVADRSPRSILAAIERGPGLFKKEVYHLAIIGIEFPDVSHNHKIANENWEQSFFSKGTYRQNSITGQPTFGSVNDYYDEVSNSSFHVEGKMFDWVTVGRKRAEYAPGSGDTLRMLPEALDKLLAREGKKSLDEFDGITFIYAGDRLPTNRGGLFWPHKGLVPHEGKRWNYLIVQEGGARMTNISVFTHEFGHLLGLSDLYARPENPGSEGLGIWCLMSNQTPNGRPQHMSAWCKEQLGWLKPTVIDPAVPQKLVLSPIEGSNRECFKIPLRADGSEYLLLENRRLKGFDADLPGEGLLIWRVVGNRPYLVESHGIEGPAGPRTYLKDVPFPSNSNRAFTPFTTPSSRSIMGGGAAVFITEIERLADGRITFAVGYPSY